VVNYSNEEFCGFLLGVFCSDLSKSPKESALDHISLAAWLLGPCENDPNCIIRRILIKGLSEVNLIAKEACLESCVATVMVKSFPCKNPVFCQS